MSRREDIDNAIWSDPEFAELSPNAKLTYLWSFTNQRCGMAGLYKLALNMPAIELGLPVADVQAAIDELAAARMAFYESNVLWVRARVKHIRTRTPQIARSIVNDVEKLSPDHPLRIKFLEAYGEHPWLREQFAVMAPPGGWETATYVSRAQRERIFTRDDWKCIDCGSPDDLTIDHRTPRSHGGDNSDENLATRCRPCNTRKGPRADLAPQAGIREPLTGTSNRGSARTSNRRFQGQGRGQGQGRKVGGTGGGNRDWTAWAEQNLPDLPSAFAASAAQIISSTGNDVTPDAVRRRVLAQHPELEAA